MQTEKGERQKGEWAGGQNHNRPPAFWLLVLPISNVLHPLQQQQMPFSPSSRIQGALPCVPGEPALCSVIFLHLFLFPFQKSIRTAALGESIKPSFLGSTHKWILAPAKSLARHSVQPVPVEAASTDSPVSEGLGATESLLSVGAGAGQRKAWS